MKNVLSVSTGGFYLYAMAYGTAYAMQRVQFDKMIGASAGAVIVAVSAIHGGQEMLKKSQFIDLRKAYSFIPFYAGGKIKPRAGWRFAIGKSLAIQDGRELIRSVITERDFKRYKQNDKAPRAYVLSVCMESRSRFVWDLKQLDYPTAIDAIEASTRMQGIAKGLRMVVGGKETYQVDGGQLEHVPSMHLLNADVDNLVSIYSWPENWQLPPTKIGKRDGIKEHFEMIKMDNHEKAHNDMFREEVLCKEFDIKRYQIYTQRSLLHSFDVDYQRQKIAQKSNYNSAVKALGHFQII
jgi:predicted acylesterase/phospholipase RssA